MMKISITEEGTQNNCALGDKCLKYCIDLGMGTIISKTTAYKLVVPPGGQYAQIQDGHHQKSQFSYLS